jgi:MoaA/NifB/PqqE/SkfB family radical SAM enzyme
MGWDAKILLTRKCNLRCEFCKIRRNERLNGELTLSQWKKGLKNLEKIGVKSLQILGGEPTQSNFLIDLIHFLNEETQMHYSIESNSTFNEDLYKKLIDAEIKGYAADVNTFEFTSKKDWYAIKSHRGFQMLLKMKTAKVPYLEASIIINKKNIKHLPLIAKKLNSLGIWSNFIPLHYGKSYPWEFRAEDVGNEYKIQEADRKQVYTTMKSLFELKNKGYLILNEKEYFINLARINCNPLGWHCDRFPRLRIDADGSLWICNDVKGKVASKYSILTLNKKSYQQFEHDWNLDPVRINCPGCAWPIAWAEKK